MADAMNRPYTATASGGDWAFIKENNLPGLVSGWIALSYAAGQFLMVPHRQWCYTPEKGTHLSHGPDLQSRVDGVENHGPVGVHPIKPHHETPALR